MTIEFKTPTPEDVAKMRDFASIIDSALSKLNTPELAQVGHVTATKLQEALMWFSHGVLNKTEHGNTESQCKNNIEDAVIIE